MDLLIVVAAALCGGVINALAGGGSFLTLPALVFTGVPPVMANATGTTTLLPGYLASVWGSRDLIRAPHGMTLLAVIALGALGGSLGASLLLLTSNDAFSAIVPWLLLFATGLFALGPRIHRALSTRFSHRHSLPGRLSVLAVSIYGGYFAGGMGIVMLAAFRLLGVDDLNLANALKNLLSAVLTVIAVTVYAIGGAIAWGEVLPMAIAASIGGMAGAKIGRRLPPAVLRAGIVAVGALTTVVFFVD
ncbi:MULTISPECIES: sulfite exporter TauE/SafE family protein [Spiribacter]|jgi:uncharacterized membrane protein YfcA|uniref:sulfite exporter TauE/SafE family protein n=1 Tax=Spiribacter TaxID=1335745 RepID=UPI000F6CCDFC|nr:MULTISPECIES: sulfite exporter TauE/SafE family protein [Spiribacter]AUB78447.1 hypothetical protein BBH56_04630 [Spiribacter roseus]KAF0283394.1 hypothetical protein BA898_00990 [Spiribacter roseus]KAF0284786.1 hypothetical protein BA899_07610 [Spiribacter sp. SSL99]